MSMPFYVSPEQVMADKAEFARKGISRGKSIVALEHQGGRAADVGESDDDCSKIGEIYDRIAFAGVGKFSEFDQLRKIGVRFADTKGYAYSREDVRGGSLAHAFSQVMGEAFTREVKPLEVEIIIAEVGDDRYEDHKENSLYRDQVRRIHQRSSGFLRDWRQRRGRRVRLEERLSRWHARGGGRQSRSACPECGSENSALEADSLEVCLLDRERTGRKFCRLSADEVQGMLDGS